MPERPVRQRPFRAPEKRGPPKRYYFTAFMLDKPVGIQKVTERRACSQGAGTTLSAMQFLPSRTPVRLGACALLALLSIGLHSTALAQWKWRDGKGHVQYSDLPPPSTVAEQDILQRPAGAGRRATAPTEAPATMAPSSAAAPASGPRTSDPELEAKRRKAEQDEAAKRKAEEDKQAAARAENCKRAQAQQKALDDGIRMARVNAKGEREVMDDKARAEESRRMREVMSTDCK